MERLAGAGAPRVFVGDGLSDRYAAGAADVVFAKNSLAAYCAEHSIPYTPYTSLSMVAWSLDELLVETTMETFYRKAVPTK